MIDRILVLSCVAVLSCLCSGCLVDCKVCSDATGECASAESIDRDDCDNCTNDAIISALASKDENNVSDATINEQKRAGVTFTCERE